MALPFPQLPDSAYRAIETAVAPLGRYLSDRRRGSAGSIVHAPVLDVPETITVTSPAFEAGQELPDRFCGIGIGLSVPPPLAWAGIPEGTQRLLLVLEDLDFPSERRTGLHTGAVFAPTGPSGTIVEGELVRGNPRFAFLREQGHRPGYAAPRPLPGHGTHRYVFHLFALAAPITPPPDAALASLLRLLTGQVLARGALMVTRTA